MRGIGYARLFTGVGNVIQSLASGIVPVTLKGASGQTADMLKVVNSAGTELFSIPASGIPLLTAGGIKFPATQVPSGDVNVLDDYEEGTWTPALTFTTPGNLSVSYAAQTGRYVKIGRQVLFSGYLACSSFTHTTASSLLRLTGLPFSPSSSMVFSSMGTAAMRGYTKAGFTHLSLEAPNGAGSFCYVQASGSGVALTELTAADVPTGETVQLWFNGHYEV